MAGTIKTTKTIALMTTISQMIKQVKARQTRAKKTTKRKKTTANLAFITRSKPIEGTGGGKGNKARTRLDTLFDGVHRSFALGAMLSRFFLQ